MYLYDANRYAGRHIDGFNGVHKRYGVGRGILKWEC